MDTGQCVHCGLCLPTCPTYHITGLEMQSPRGRLVLLQSELDQAGRQWLDDCLDCRACEAICPAHVPTGHLVEEWRSKSPSKASWTLSMLTPLIGSRRGLAWFQRLVRWSRLPIVRALMSRVVPSLARLSQGVFEPPSHGLSRDRAQAGSSGPQRTFLFVGCVMDAIYPDTNLHTLDMLNWAGCSVQVPDQVCCGALHLHSGNRQQARVWAQKNIEQFENSGCEVIVVNAAGCGTTLKEYPQLFAEDLTWRPRAERFSHAVVDALVFFSQHPLPQLSPHHTPITIHDACHHVHGQGIWQEPRTLLTRAGYELTEMADSTRCCGSAGIYNVNHPELSHALLSQKLDSIPADVQIVASANPGCILQIQSGLAQHHSPVRVHHPIDLAWMAYRTHLGGEVSDAQLAR